MTCEAKTPEDLEKLRKYAGYIRLALDKIPFVNVPANIFAIEATIADVIQDIQQGDGNASVFGLQVNTSVLSATATVNTSIVFGGAMATGIAVGGPAVFFTTMGIAIAAGVIGAANNETVRTVLSDPDLRESILNGNLGEYLNNKYGIDLSDILDAVGEAFTTGNIKDLKDLAKETACEFSKAQVAQLRRDPLILDLDGDGLETVGINTTNPILFDHDGDGVKSATGWIKPDDGFLVLDRNGNGVIDDGTTTGMSVGTDAAGNPVIHINMNGSQDALLDQAYSVLKESAYDALLQQTRLKPYLDDIDLSLTGIAFDLHHLMGGTLEAVGWNGLVLFTDWVATDAVTSTLRAFDLQAANDEVFVIRRAG